MYLFCAALDVLWGEKGQLFEVWVLGPHGLGDHLSQFHSSQCRTQPAVTGQDVDTGLDQTDSLQTKIWVKRVPVTGQLVHPQIGKSAPCSGSPQCQTAAQHSAAFWTGEPAAEGWSSHGDHWTWGCSICGAPSVPAEIYIKKIQKQMTALVNDTICKTGFLEIITISLNLTEKCVFMVSDGNVLVLRSVGDYFN